MKDKLIITAPALYAEIIAKIRARTDILIDSTLGQITVKEDENRLAHIKLMGQQTATRPDFAAVDTGSSNIDAYDPVAKAFKTENKVYLNSTETGLFLAKGMTQAGVKPHLSVWGVPFVRMVDAFLDMGAIQEPAYVQCVLAEGGIVGAHLAPGIGDYAYPELGAPTNAELVRRCAELGRAVGREPATTDETRAMLGIAREPVYA